MKIKKILKDVKAGKTSPEEAYSLLKNLPYQDLGFAKIDHHRQLRKGFPEVIFCPGKSIEQIVTIIQKSMQNQHNVLATRATPEVFKKVKKIAPHARYSELGKIITITKKQEKKKRSKKILIITAGTADMPVAEEATVTAEFLGNSVEKLYDVGVAGIHRLFGNLEKLDQAAVIIVIAGMEGALASVIGGLVDKPVIAVPTSVGYGANFKGLTALLAMMNSCAPGVAVVNIDNGFGAACMANAILGVSKTP